MLELVQHELKAHFRPEFLNRVDEVLVFHRLGTEHMRAIVRIQLDRLNQLLAERRIAVEADDAALEFLSREGYEPEFGARPLKRAIQRLVQDPLAAMVLAGEIADGDTVRLTVRDGALALVPAVPVEAAGAAAAQPAAGSTTPMYGRVRKRSAQSRP